MTIRELIARLEEVAREHGEDTRVAVYDDYTANEGWDYEEEDLYLDPTPHLDEDTGIVLL